MRTSTLLPLPLLSLFSLLSTPLHALPTPAPNTSTIAGGSTPNSDPPPTLSKTASGGFQAALFLENLETAFFTQGAQNLSNIWNSSTSTITTVSKVAAQESIHVQAIEGLLSHFNVELVPACKYDFGVESEMEFLELANLITTVGIGAVIDLAVDTEVSDPALTQTFASILPVEARHDAFFRMEAGDGDFVVPNPTPFDTRLPGAYALNLAQQFVVEGSCAVVPDFPVIPALEILSSTFCETSSRLAEVSFSFDASLATSGQKLYIAWLNQLNTPTYVEAEMAGEGVVKAQVPENVNGGAFAVLTAQDTVMDVSQLVGVSVAGPAVVVVD
ncbi:MAG: hypothetical protein M1834_008339 [Cirrosporium novae-zelandiae]|nr:MAG: hypothetical protein M1834_008339 [Cirrosporium novae-zelandiae]